eukprot:5998488-Pleurochrysis_carterae.AAC.1
MPFTEIVLVGSDTVRTRITSEFSFGASAYLCVGAQYGRSPRSRTSALTVSSAASRSGSAALPRKGVPDSKRRRVRARAGAREVQGVRQDCSQQMRGARSMGTTSRLKTLHSLQLHPMACVPWWEQIRWCNILQLAFNWDAPCRQFAVHTACEGYLHLIRPSLLAAHLHPLAGGSNRNSHPYAIASKDAMHDRLVLPTSLASPAVGMNACCVV